MDHLLKTKKKKKKISQNRKFKIQNELDKACIQYNMVYGDFKDLHKRTASDTVLSDKAFNIAKTSKYKKCQEVLLQCLTKF